MAGDAVIAAGFGFRAQATAESLADAWQRAAPAGVVPRVVATAEAKAAHPAFTALALRLGAEARGIDHETLAAQKTSTQSAASYTVYETGSVAEAAALAAAGAGARLLAPRVVSDDGQATCALAERTGP